MPLLRSSRLQRSNPTANIHRASVRAPTPVVLDLTGVRFTASSGLNSLVRFHQLGVERGTPLRVAATGRAVLRPIHETDLDQLLEIHATVPEALAVPVID